MLQITGLYQNLYDAIGNAYGGDAQQNTFAVPDFRGRVAAHTGQEYAGDDPLTPIILGQPAGQNNVAITVAQMPGHAHGQTHGHAANAVNAYGNAATPGHNLLAREPIANAGRYYTGQGETKVPMEPDAIAQDTTTSDYAGGTGTDDPPKAGGHNNMQPLLGINFMICFAGAPA